MGSLLITDKMIYDTGWTGPGRRREAREPLSVQPAFCKMLEGRNRQLRGWGCYETECSLLQTGCIRPLANNTDIVKLSIDLNGGEEITVLPVLACLLAGTPAMAPVQGLLQFLLLAS